jgi:tyrosyl-tRNA synthetase
MDIETKIELVKRKPTQEVIVEQELCGMFETHAHPRHYIGYEISGYLHIGSLVLAGNKINDFAEAGMHTIVFLADWHAMLNNKLGGDWEKITIASRYYREAFKFFCPQSEIILGSDLYHHNDAYWRNYVYFSKQITLARNTRCLTILGRKEGDQLDFGAYLYPPLQAVDIREMDLDVVHAGMDQRKVHMLVRDTFPRLKWKVPVAVHHHLVGGLQSPTRMGYEMSEKLDFEVSNKMSKSVPDSAIFIHDSDDEIRRKIQGAYCPAKVIENNPIIDYVDHLVLRSPADVFTIERPAKYGGTITIDSMRKLKKDYSEGKIHPLDLKNAISECLIRIVAPIRRHFEDRHELLEVYGDVDITR